MASRREPIKDAIISNCFPWFCCIPSITAVSFSPCFSIDSRLFLMESASSLPMSSAGNFLFLVCFLSFQHCLLEPAKWTSPSDISLPVALMLLGEVPLSGGLGVSLVLCCDPSWSLGGFALGKDGEAVLVPDWLPDWILPESPEKVLRDGMALMWVPHRVAVDSVKLVRAVVVLVGLKWQHLQGYLGSWPRLMESSVEKTVPVAAWAMSGDVSGCSCTVLSQMLYVGDLLLHECGFTRYWTERPMEGTCNCRLTGWSFGVAVNAIPVFLSLFSRVIPWPSAERQLSRQSSCNCAVASCRKMAVQKYIFVCEWPLPVWVLAIRVWGICDSK